jgi:hypothetical protein
MRGGKIGDYTEFEEEEVDLNNLLGNKADHSKPTTGISSNMNSVTSFSSNSNKSKAATVKDDNEFDVDF